MGLYHGSSYESYYFGITGPIFLNQVPTVPNYHIPDPREDLESRTPILGPFTTKGYFIGTPLRDLLSGSSRGSGILSKILTYINYYPKAEYVMIESRFLSGPCVIRVPFFRLFGSNKGTPK